MQEKRANSISEVDMSGLKMPVIAVYERPDDYPDKYVARVFDILKPTGIAIVKSSLSEIQEDIGANTSMVFFLREAGDVLSLVGTWV